MAAGDSGAATAQGSQGAGANADPLVGKVLHGRFTVLELLGGGGMGRVYKAVQAPLDRLVALKVLSPDFAGDKDPQFQKRFFLEASLTSQLRHPNTITVIDYGRTEDGIFYIAMEYLEGQTLSELLTRTGPLPWTRALQIAQQISRSLREAHKHGIIHRDIKPANVMLLKEDAEIDVVKVLDFGLVKSLAPERAQEMEMTQAGIFLGSPTYMAPEQARQHADARSDVYSLGVVLFQMLCGRPPFSADQTIDLIFKHINEPPPPLRRFHPQLVAPPEIEALVRKCLEKDPAERFQSMDELIEAMRRAASAGGSSGLFTGPRAGPDSGPRPIPPETESPTSALDSVEIEVVEEPPADALPSSSAWKWAVPLAVLAVAAGFGVVVVMERDPALPTAPPAAAPSEPAAAVEPPPPAPEIPSAPVPSPVKFVISSDPLGAKVSLDGQELGVTPVEFERFPGEGGAASGELTFALPGYESVTVVAAGTGPTVEFTQALKKSPERTAPRKKKPSNKRGYKDDPYE